MCKLLSMFVTVLMILPVAYAKQSKRQQVNRTVHKQARMAKQNFPYVYNHQWFVSLSEKQQSVYLKEIAYLAGRLAGGRNFSMNPFMQLIVPYLDAETINNGYIYDGNFNSFIENQNFGSLKPNCPSGHHPCAIYTGLVKDSSGNLKVSCSRDSTPTCVKNGDRNLLKETLRQCKYSGKELCQVVKSLMERGTANVAKYCESKRDTSSSGLKAACDNAKQALEQAGVPASPIASDPPAGENCAKVAEEATKITEANRSSTGSSAKYQNNKFWRDTLSFARKACGNNNSVSGMTEIAGVCDVSNMQTSSGQATRNKPVIIAKDASGPANFNRCLKAQENRLNVERDRKLDAILTDGSLSPKVKRQKMNQITEMYKRRVATANAAEKCTLISVVGTGDKFVPRFDILSLDQDFMKKFRSGDLSEHEENVFKAATGMNSKKFKKAFCDSKNHNQFRANLKNSLAYRNSVRADMTSSENRELEGQAKTAYSQMNRCLGSLKTVEETECGFKDLFDPTKGKGDPNAIRSATEKMPIIAKNIKTGKCILVNGWQRKTIQSLNKYNETVNKYVDLISYTDLDKTTQDETLRERPETFASQYYLKAYQCSGDVVPRPTYSDPKADPYSEDGPVTSEI